ncbi:MAG: hypothetical protein HY899_02900 [Deltaproteobacteria bacterium]|nr:hypothetical protein [Deltaproteobacteria bacterium]
MIHRSAGEAEARKVALGLQLAVAAALVVGLAAALLVARMPDTHSNRSLMRLRDAMTHGDLGHVAEAESAFADAIELAKADASVHDEQAALLMRAEWRMSAGDRNGASSDLDRVVAMDGTVIVPAGGVVAPDESRFIAYVDRAIVRLHGGDREGARDDLTAAFSAIPDYSAQRLYYLERQRDHGVEWAQDCDAAIAERTRIIESGGSSPDAMLAYAERGACRSWTGDEEGARADFVRSNELRQNPGLIYFFRGVVSQARHDCRAALADYAEALRLAPRPRPRPPHRRSPSSQLYGYHADRFAEAAAGASAVVPRFEAVEQNVAACVSGSPTQRREGIP